MEVELSREDQHTGLKLRFDVLMAEYHMVRDKVARYRQMQGQLDGLALTALGLSIPLILIILERNVDAVGAFLFVPMLFFAIAFTQLRYERQIDLDAIYVHSRLRPQISKLLSRMSASDVPVLEYEFYLARHYFAPNLLVQWLITSSRAAISLGVGIGLITVVVYLKLALFKLDWHGYESWLLLIAVVMLIGDLGLGFFIARLPHDFYTKQREYMETPESTGCRHQ